jgi:PadR family transcriptional regulator
MGRDDDVHHQAHEHHGAHRGWVRPGGRRGRWVEPFLLRLIAEGDTHGGALITRLNGLCLAPGGVDVGMAYRTLREFEAEGLVASRWMADGGTPRRSYSLTVEGREALDEWIEVMRERARLIDAFLDGTESVDHEQGA